MIVDAAAEKRFRSKFRESDGCWVWQGTMQNYPVFWLNGRYHGAHRVSHFMATGEIPQLVHHKCSNHLCVRPDHLQGVTHQEHLELSPNWITKKQADQTHCKRGHLLDEQNTYKYKNQRHCRVCHAAAQRRYTERQEAC